MKVLKTYSDTTLSVLPGVRDLKAYSGTAVSSPLKGVVAGLWVTYCCILESQGKLIR